MSQKVKIIKERKFTKQLLESVIERDEATLIGEYEKVNSITPITFLCKCGIQNKKCFKNVYDRGMTCVKCTSINQKERHKKTILEIYGVEYASQSKEVKEKVKATVLERYGVDNIAKNKEIHKKIKATNLVRYGYECAVKNKEIQDKKKATILERYGNEYNSHNGMTNEARKKAKATNLARYGFECPLQNKEIREKGKKTNLKKYGVEFSCQNNEISEKIMINSKKFKEHKMPSGEIRKVQGYEPFALIELVKSYSEEQIKTNRSDVPRIKYELDGINKYYFPDIYIPHENRLIEVKSTWTYKSSFNINMLKKKACEEQGFLYEFWCFNYKGRKIELPVIS